MGRQSTRANKNIYQICREECELTRERASEMMTGVSASRIEKIEYNLQDPTPYDIVQMADCYKRPDECYDNFIKNTFCRHLTLEKYFHHLTGLYPDEALCIFLYLQNQCTGFLYNDF